MKKKMKIKKKVRVSASYNMASKMVIGVIVLISCCAVGVHGARHSHRRTPEELEEGRTSAEISQSVSASSTNQSHQSYKEMFSKLTSQRHVKRILAIGDSVTEGFIQGGVHYYPYTNYLEELLNAAFNDTRFEVLNDGVGTDNASKYFVDRFDGILEREEDHGVSFVVIVFGSDEYRKAECQHDEPIADNIIELNKIAHNRSLTTILGTIPGAADMSPSCKKARFRGNKKLRKYAMAEKERTLLLDLAVELPNENLFDFDRKIYWDDAVHPSKIGYEKLADLVFHILKPAIQERTKVLFTG